MPESQNEWTSISISRDDAARIRVFADPEHRTLRGQLLVWLDAAEALYADVTPEIQGKADAVKGLSRPGALDETV